MTKFFVFFVVDIVSIAVAVANIGFWLSILWLALDCLVGAWVLSVYIGELRTLATQANRRAQSIRGKFAMMFVGLLVLFPGFFSDVVAGGILVWLGLVWLFAKLSPVVSSVEGEKKNQPSQGGKAVVQNDPMLEVILEDKPKKPSE